MVRIHISVSGRVQGVGSRYFTQECACICELTGWVRNEWDGSVTLELQGDEDNVNRVVAMLRLGNRFIHVEKLTREEIPVLEEERGFHIRY